jgi:sugar transferase EpsL
MDIAFASSLVILLSPLIVVVAVVVRIAFGRGVFFLQARPGKNEQVFRLVKFRTMTNATDNDGQLLTDEFRITRVGKFLRQTSLDELPSLINVLRGELSFVGPRPLLVKYLPLYSPAQSRRHDVTPGVTGWAQVNGRNAISWTEKFELDLWYIENQNFWLDFQILLRTVASVARRSNISTPGFTTAPDFDGSN